MEVLHVLGLCSGHIDPASWLRYRALARRARIYETVTFRCRLAYRPRLRESRNIKLLNEDDLNNNYVVWKASNESRGSKARSSRATGYCYRG